MLKVAITGVESSGKTSLARALSMHFDGVFVPEYAREYFQIYPQRIDNYQINDIVEIAKVQQDSIKTAEKSTADCLFADTEMLVCKIWAEEIFGKCPEWIEQAFQAQAFQLYLLVYPDLIWEPDPLREAPDLKQREYLFERYQQTLDQYAYSYEIIKGWGDKRFQTAIGLVKKLR